MCLIELVPREKVSMKQVVDVVFQKVGSVLLFLHVK